MNQKMEQEMTNKHNKRLGGVKMEAFFCPNREKKNAVSAKKRRVSANARSQQAPLKRVPLVRQRGKVKGAFGSAYTLISPRPLETFAACLPAVYDGVPAQRREI